MRVCFFIRVLAELILHGRLGKAKSAYASRCGTKACLFKAIDILRFSKMSIFFLLSLSFSSYLLAQEQLVKIGVLALRGKDKALSDWEESGRYLQSSIEGYSFEITPLSFDEIEPSVAEQKIDFLIANPSIYVVMEHLHKISGIATMKHKIGDSQPMPIFGGAIFTLADNTKINDIKELKGKDFVAVDRSSLGGWQMAWGEFEKLGIKPDTFFKSLRFVGTHDAAIVDVLEGRADAGTARSDILASMIREGKIDPKKVKVLNPIKCVGVPFPNSTVCYPEWPIAKLQHTPDFLANQVATALIQLKSDHIASITSGVHGWSVPYNYHAVHELLGLLRLPPYDKTPQIELKYVLKKYWHVLTLSILLGFIATFFILYVTHLNQRLKTKSKLIQKSLNDLKLMQSHLVESEKMASLGALVAGISHEINTPLGSAITSGSILEDECKILKEHFENGTLDESVFTNSINNIDEATKLMLKNLNRAAKLVKTFKEISVDQSSEELREFDIKSYTEEIIQTFGNQLKRFPINVTVLSRDNLSVLTYPGVYAQIIGNLIQNSVMHAFEPQTEGAINIKITELADLIMLEYSDNGKGVDPSVKDKIFEPFVTTKRGSGGSGLGMNIVYNLITQKLHGEISLKETTRGASFVLKFPRRITNG